MTDRADQMGRTFAVSRGGWRALAAAAALAAFGWSAPLSAKPSELEPTPPGTSLEEGLLETEPAEPAAPRAEEIFFDEASWRALVEGKTLYYRTPTGVVGREYYPPGGNRAVFEYAGDGACFEGTWNVVGNLFCFNYDSRHCFRHLSRDGVIYARQMDGVDQRVFRITDEPLSCAKGLTS